MAAAAAGLLGSGPLGKATAVAPGAFTVEYERLSRYQAPQTLQIQPRAIKTMQMRGADDERREAYAAYVAATNEEATTQMRRVSRRVIPEGGQRPATPP